MGLPVKIKQELKGTTNTTSNKNEHHKTPITKINYNNLTNRSARSTIRLQENLRLKKKNGGLNRSKKGGEPWTVSKERST